MPTLLATENVTKQDRLCHRGREEEEEEEEEQQQQQQQQEEEEEDQEDGAADETKDGGEWQKGVRVSSSREILAQRRHD